MLDDHDLHQQQWMRRLFSQFPDLVFREDNEVAEGPIDDWGGQVKASTAQQSKTRGNTDHTTTFSGGEDLHPAVTAARAVRKELRLTQASFARCLEVSARTLRDWEQNRRHPSGAAVTLLKWAADRPDYIRELHRARLEVLRSCVSGE